MVMGRSRVPGYEHETVHVLEGHEATCQFCGLVYPSGLRFEVGLGVGKLMMLGNIPGTAVCPRCGGPGSIGELYTVIGEGLVRLTESARVQPGVVSDILRAAIGRRATDVTPIIAEIQEAVPQEQAFIDWLARAAPIGKLLVPFLTLLLAALAILSNRYPHERTPVESSAPSAEEIRVAIEKAMASQRASPKAPEPSRDKNRRKRLRKKHRQ